MRHVQACAWGWTLCVRGCVCVQVDEAGEAAEVVDEHLVEHLGLPAKACERSSLPLCSLSLCSNNSLRASLPVLQADCQLPVNALSAPSREYLCVQTGQTWRLVCL